MSEYIYSGDKYKFKFIQLPKVMFEGDDPLTTLSLAAKVLYAIFLDEISLSLKKGFVDEQNRAYIYFPQVKMCKILGCSAQKVRKAIRELESFDLIERKRLGQGFSDKIYVKTCTGFANTRTGSETAPVVMRKQEKKMKEKSYSTTGKKSRKKADSFTSDSSVKTHKKSTSEHTEISFPKNENSSIPTYNIETEETILNTETEKTILRCKSYQIHPDCEKDKMDEMDIQKTDIPESDLHRTFARVLNYISDQGLVSACSIDTWFRTMLPVSFEKENLTFAVETDFQKDLICSNVSYISSLKTAYEQVTGRSVCIDLQVMPNLFENLETERPVEKIHTDTHEQPDEVPESEPDPDLISFMPEENAENAPEPDNTPENDQQKSAMPEAKTKIQAEILTQIGAAEIYEKATDDEQRFLLQEIVSVMEFVQTSTYSTLFVNGSPRKVQTVREQFRKLNQTHISYVITCMQETTSCIKNRRSYLLTSLWNAPATINTYYASRKRYEPIRQKQEEEDRKMQEYLSLVNQFDVD